SIQLSAATVRTNGYYADKAARRNQRDNQRGLGVLEESGGPYLHRSSVKLAWCKWFSQVCWDTCNVQAFLRQCLRDVTSGSGESHYCSVMFSNPHGDLERPEDVVDHLRNYRGSFRDGVNGSYLVGSILPKLLVIVIAGEEIVSDPSFHSMPK